MGKGDLTNELKNFYRYPRFGGKATDTGSSSGHPVLRSCKSYSEISLELRAVVQKL